jgi:hypothetical protein
MVSELITTWRPGNGDSIGLIKLACCRHVMLEPRPRRCQPLTCALADAHYDETPAGY